MFTTPSLARGGDWEINTNLSVSGTRLQYKYFVPFPWICYNNNNPVLTYFTEMEFGKQQR